MNSSTQNSRIPLNKSRKTHHDEHDHISSLPDCLISDILSRLPMNEAVRTSVLSKDWEHKWTSRHEILLSDFFCTKGNFVNFVERTLLLPSGGATLKAHPGYGPGYSLRELEIVVPCNFKVSAEFSFPYLTTLKLEDIKIFNELSNSDPVKFSFPVLKTFMLLSCEWLNVKFVEICAPKLTSFRCMAPWGYEVNDYSIKITGDSLVKFESSGVIPLNIILCGGSEVVYADLRNGWIEHWSYMLEMSGLQFRKLLKGLPSLKELELSNFVVKAIAITRLGEPLPMFYKMERLVLSYHRGNTEALLELLHSTPILKILDLKLRGWKDHDYDAEEYVPSCILSHLEIVKFTCNARTMHQVLKLAKFFLKNAVQLKKVCFSVSSKPCPQNLKNKITEELSTFPKASTTSTTAFT